MAGSGDSVAASEEDAANGNQNMAAVYTPM